MPPQASKILVLDDQTGCASSRQLRGVVRFDATVNLKGCIRAARVKQQTGAAHLVDRAGDQGLSAEARIDRHDQEQVEVDQHLFDHDQWCRRRQRRDRPGCRACATRKRAVEMAHRLMMHRDQGRSSRHEAL